MTVFRRSNAETPNAETPIMPSERQAAQLALQRVDADRPKRQGATRADESGLGRWKKRGNPRGGDIGVVESEGQARIGQAHARAIEARRPLTNLHVHVFPPLAKKRSRSACVHLGFLLRSRRHRFQLFRQRRWNMGLEGPVKLPLLQSLGHTFRTGADISAATRRFARRIEPDRAVRAAHDPDQ